MSVYLVVSLNVFGAFILLQVVAVLLGKLFLSLAYCLYNIKRLYVCLYFSRTFIDNLR